MHRIISSKSTTIGSLYSNDINNINDKIHNFNRVYWFLRTYFNYTAKIKSDFHYLDY